MKKILGAFILLCIAVGLTTGAIVYNWWTSPPPASQESKAIEYEVMEGTTLGRVADDLAKAGVLRFPLLFRLYGRAAGLSGKMKAGFYAIETGLLPREVMEKLVKGKVLTVQFGFPEGINMWQVAERLAEVFPDTPKAGWQSLMKSAEFRKRLPKEATSVEGYLFPETYTFSPRATPQEVISAMIATFEKNFTLETQEKGRALGLTPHQIVTLASIVEKETGKASERPQITSVFLNRLKIRMRLQTDPTVIYGIWERFDGNLRKIDLQTPNPFNTYTNDGLPPGPIANPGKEALLAAVQPSSTKALYFVGKGDGSHKFSESLTEHNKAVFEFQIKPFRKAKSKARHE